MAAGQRPPARIQFTTGIVALPCGDGYPTRLLDVVPGRCDTALGG